VLPRVDGFQGLPIWGEEQKKPRRAGGERQGEKFSYVSETTGALGIRSAKEKAATAWCQPSDDGSTHTLYARRTEFGTDAAPAWRGRVNIG
jgi:hypothetical protein